MLRTMGILKNAFDDKGINAWVDLWGHDVNP